jgi:YggT family protein
MTSILQILLLLLDVAQFVVLAHIILSWLINFGVLNPRQQFVGQLWQALNRLLQPIYDQVRRIIPQTGTLDFAPLVVLLGIYAARIVVMNNAAAFY